MYSEEHYSLYLKKNLVFSVWISWWWNMVFFIVPCVRTLLWIIESLDHKIRNLNFKINYILWYWMGT